VKANPFHIRGRENCAAHGPPRHCLDELVATEGIAGYLHAALGEALAAADVMGPVGERREQAVGMVIALGRPRTLGWRLRSTRSASWPGWASARGSVFIARSRCGTA
jgi:hypothetical protein